MKYRFTLSYKPTDGGAEVTREGVKPIYGDDPNVAIERVDDEWYYTRKLGGKFTFVREDYSWIMVRPFDGTYTMTVGCSTDGSSWQEYFVGTFSRASLTIDEDNQNAVLDGLSEGTYNVIENAKDTEYDLRKVIPDTEAKEVQGEIWPALALVDYRQSSITRSDIYCNGASVGGGYDSKHPESGFKTDEKVVSDDAFLMCGIYCEGNVKLDGVSDGVNGRYAGELGYGSIHVDYPSGESIDEWAPIGVLQNESGCRIGLYIINIGSPSWITMYRLVLEDAGGQQILVSNKPLQRTVNSPDSFTFENESIEFVYHYIRATLLTTSAEGVEENVLNVANRIPGPSARVRGIIL